MGSHQVMNINGSYCVGGDSTETAFIVVFHHQVPTSSVVFFASHKCTPSSKTVKKGCPKIAQCVSLLFLGHMKMGDMCVLYVVQNLRYINKS